MLEGCTAEGADRVAAVGREAKLWVARRMAMAHSDVDDSPPPHAHAFAPCNPVLLRTPCRRYSIFHVLSVSAVGSSCSQTEALPSSRTPKHGFFVPPSLSMLILIAAGRPSRRRHRRRVHLGWRVRGRVPQKPQARQALHAFYGERR